jgi:hypothetical protein
VSTAGIMAARHPAPVRSALRIRKMGSGGPCGVCGCWAAHRPGELAPRYDQRGIVKLHAEAQRSQLSTCAARVPDDEALTWSGLRRRRYRGFMALKWATSGAGEVVTVAACAERVVRRTARALE